MWRGPSVCIGFRNTYLEVRLSVVECCVTPEVAVTVKLTFTGVSWLVLVELPPQAMSSAIEPKIRTSSIATCKRRRRVPRPKKPSGKQSIMDANTERETFVSEANTEVCLLMVSVVVAVVASDGITAVGEKLHTYPAGRPEQANQTASLKPPMRLTVNVTVPGVPVATATELAEAVKVKPGVIVKVPEATALSW